MAGATVRGGARRWWGVAVAGMAVVTALAGGGGRAAAAAPASIPVSFIQLGGGLTRPVVQVSVGGGKSVPVLLDTGSTGLHILSSAVGKKNVTRTRTATSESYADGSSYAGVLAKAPVSFSSGVATSGPIYFEAIGSVGCVKAKPSCPGRSGATGLVKRGLYGTMGVSLSPFRAHSAQAPMYSPLLQVPGGSSGFSIGYQSATGGTITIGAAAGGSGGSDVLSLAPASPASYANGARAWNVASARGCWTVGNSSRRACGYITFDTGTPAAGVYASQVGGAGTNGRQYSPGQTVTVSTPAGAAPFWRFTTGSGQSHTELTTSAPAASLTGTTGNEIYYFETVTYDAAVGQIIVG